MVISLFLIFSFCYSISNAAIVPFKVSVPETILSELRIKLEHTRFPDTIESDKNWEYGADLTYLKNIVEYWKTTYNWTKQEEILNQMPQFTTVIDGFTLHFVHARSKYPNAQPLMIVHGWPGSFFEFHKILPMLLDPVAYGGKEEDAFHVIAPSIPGYGFSSAPKEKGFDQVEAAKLFIQLMKDLGYGGSYWVQGGDWGAFVTYFMANLDSNVKGYHTNLPIATPPWAKGPFAWLKIIATLLFPSQMVSQEDLPAYYGNLNLLEFFRASGYFHQQTTQPQTLGYGLNDSPVGLAAWILEKFYRWSDCNGNLDSIYTKDELLTNIMLYWVTGTITSSTRFYFELLNGKNDVFNLLTNSYLKTPTGVAVFPGEIVGLKGVRTFSDFFYNIQHWTVYKSGGHFAAMEVPLVLAQDIWKFKRTVEQLPQKNKVEI